MTLPNHLQQDTGDIFALLDPFSTHLFLQSNLIILENSRVMYSNIVRLKNVLLLFLGRVQIIQRNEIYRIQIQTEAKTQWFQPCKFSAMVATTT